MYVHIVLVRLPTHLRRALGRHISHIESFVHEMRECVWLKSAMRKHPIQTVNRQTEKGLTTGMRIYMYLFVIERMKWNETHVK